MSDVRIDNAGTLSQARREVRSALRMVIEPYIDNMLNTAARGPAEPHYRQVALRELIEPVWELIQKLTNNSGAVQELDDLKHKVGVVRTLYATNTEAKAEQGGI